MLRFLSILLLLAAGCATENTNFCAADDIRAAIDAEIQRGVRATIEEDIDAYMDGVPDDYRIVEDDGSVTDKETLRANALRSWAVIDGTRELKIVIDSIVVAPSCEEARVKTYQRWERLMRRRDNSGADVVLTTQKHDETWRLKAGRWYNVEIVELGGEIFINGEPYTP
jgi:hypothetical protein